MGSTFNAIKAFKYLIKNNAYKNPLTIDFFYYIRSNFRNQEGNYFEIGADIMEDGISEHAVAFGLP